MKSWTWSYGFLVVGCALTLGLGACKKSDKAMTTPLTDAGHQMTVDSGKITTDSGMMTSTDSGTSAAVTACVATKPAIVVDNQCELCMCNSDVMNAPFCDDDCWKISICVYVNCIISTPKNGGLADQTACSAKLCGGYGGTPKSLAASVALTPAFTTCGTPCAQEWAMKLPPKGSEDGGAADGGN